MCRVERSLPHSKTLFQWSLCMAFFLIVVSKLSFNNILNKIWQMQILMKDAGRLQTQLKVALQSKENCWKNAVAQIHTPTPHS